MSDTAPTCCARDYAVQRAQVTQDDPVTAVDVQRKMIARELLADLRRVDKALADNRRRCAAEVEATGTGLTELVGISEVLAAKAPGGSLDLHWPITGHDRR